MSTGKTIGTILGIIGLVGVLLIGSCAAVLYKSYDSNKMDVDPMVDELFASMERGDMGPTFMGLSTTESKKSMKPEQLSAMGLSLHERLGKLESKTMTGMKVQLINGESIRSVNYKAIFEKGEGVIKVQAQKEDGEWRLRFFNVNSPALHEKRTTCSSCGKTHPVNAKFCPACGEATKVAAPAIPVPATP